MFFDVSVWRDGGRRSSSIRSSSRYGMWGMISDTDSDEQWGQVKHMSGLQALALDYSRFDNETTSKWSLRNADRTPLSGLDSCRANKSDSTETRLLCFEIGTSCDTICTLGARMYEEIWEGIKMALTTDVVRAFFFDVDRIWSRIQGLSRPVSGESIGHANARRSLYRNAVLCVLGQLKSDTGRLQMNYDSMFAAVQSTQSFDGLESIFLSMLNLAPSRFCRQSSRRRLPAIESKEGHVLSLQRIRRRA